MTLKRYQFRPGINHESTSYANEGGWYDCNLIRFRTGQPEKIGGWTRLSDETYLGVCRALFNWATLGGQNLMGVGTNLKYYIERGGQYFDITPIRRSDTLTNPFDTTSGSSSVVVTDVGNDARLNDFVTFSGASPVGGLDLNGEFQIVQILTSDTYVIEAPSAASSTANGGGSVDAEYQLWTQSPIAVPITGWGAGAWGSGPWGIGSVTSGNLGVWSHSNFGEDLIYAQRNGPLCYWDASLGVTTRGTLLADDGGASDVPIAVYQVMVSDVSRFVLALGCNELGQLTLDPMLIRWSDQENPVNWTPSALNQAGGIRLSNGSEIVCGRQSRQEILVWTDSALYSLQYVGYGSGVWAPQIVGDNTSIVGPNAAVYSNGMAFWMGYGHFYKYDGSVAPIPCSVRRYVFDNFNLSQRAQVCAALNEAFNEVWWFYPSKDSNEVDRYVVYNYVDNTWYYGNMGRTAWLDSHLRRHPCAATYANNLVYHELGIDDGTYAVPQPMNAFIESSEFDIDDGDSIAFCWRLLPDIDFSQSTAANPTVTISLKPMLNSGSGYNTPLSVGGSASAGTTRTVEYPINKYTGQLNIRVRGRQMVLRVESNEVGNQWQWGTPRIDLRMDGRR